MEVVAGVDLGGTAINYTLVDREERFLIEQLCEHPALSKQGPEICLQQIADGLKIATDLAGITVDDVVAIGLDTPGPASAAGQLSARGSTNFVHPKWAGFDIREGLAHKLGKPVSYLNDANAAALWGHYAIFGATSRETSISIVVGTGNGGGIILDGNVVKGQERVRRRTWPRSDSVSEHRRYCRHQTAMQLRTNRRFRVALLAHRDRENSAAVLFATLPWPPADKAGASPGGQAGSRPGGARRCHVQRDFSGGGSCSRTFLRRNDQYVRSRCLDRGWRSSGNQSGISELVSGRNPHGDAESA